MASEFDKQIVLDLLLTPATFIMEVVGMSAAALAGLEFIGPWGYLVGLGGILGGVGWGITRIILNPDKVVEDSMQKRKERARIALFCAVLDAFDQKITVNKDWDVRKSFRELRAIYNEFQKLYPSMLETMRDDLDRQFMELFESNRKALEGAHENLLSVKGTEIDRIKRPFLERRAKSIKKVKDSIDKMTTFITGIAEAADSQNEETMGGLHDSLQDNLDIMKAVNSEMSEFMSPKVHE